MRVNRYQLENLIQNEIVEFFRSGKARSTGEELIDISTDHDSVSFSINTERLIQILRGDTTILRGGDTINTDTRMR